MRWSIGSTFLAVVLAFAAPSLAKQSRSAGARQAVPSESVKPSGFVKYCGAYFGCYTGIRLQCAADTRPYQDIAQHQCFCLPDGCR
ncbi:MAG TPA: hypothetical protein VKW08_27570 [Xanthobacteraceae bacterium]|jgi:hypothetical protein|nr:hypothetical protein [Xanthobacteraceae bacterium]